MGIADAIAAALEAANTIMKRLWGEQTSQEASLQKRAETAQAKRDEAKWRMLSAKTDDERARYLSAFNDWTGELNRLHDEADAKRTG